MADLYNSKVGIPNMRRTAPQINPGVARMYTGKGAEQVGEALFEVGGMIHQVNVTRQVAKAVAEYKMREADFMAQMANADPSEVDFGEAFKKFRASQGGLAQGVSRDASQIIQNKLAGYSANTYGNIKRLEVTNLRNKVIEESGDVFEGLLEEYTNAIIKGDKTKAAQAKQDWKDYRDGVSNAVPPNIRARLDSLWDEHAPTAMRKGTIQAITHQINAGNFKGAMEMTKHSKDILPTDVFMLKNKIEAGINDTREKNTVLLKAISNKEAEVYINHIIEGTKPTEGPETKKNRQAWEARDRMKASGVKNLDPDVYWELKNKLLNMGTPYTDMDDILLASAVMDDAQVEELATLLKQNQKLRHREKEVKATMPLIRDQFARWRRTAQKWMAPGDLLDTVLRVVDEEEQIALERTRGRFLKDDLRLDIITDHANLYSGEKITGKFLEPAIARMWKTWKNDFRTEIEDGNEDIRRVALVNLLASGEQKWAKQLAYMVDEELGWFPAAIEDMIPTPSEINKANVSKHGKRIDGTDKQDGYRGSVPIYRGGEHIGYATEYSIGSADVVPGKETLIPTIIPTLDDVEFVEMIEDIIPNEKPIPKSIANKAVAHAKKRIKEGKSPFWNPKDDVK